MSRGVWRERGRRTKPRESIDGRERTRERNVLKRISLDHCPSSGNLLLPQMMTLHEKVLSRDERISLDPLWSMYKKAFFLLLVLVLSPLSVA